MFCQLNKYRSPPTRHDDQRKHAASSVYIKKQNAIDLQFVEKVLFIIKDIIPGWFE